jgi:hypothetical protein
MRNPGITRHMRDLERLKTIQAVVDRELRPGRAAERLGLTVRQVERLVIRYRAEGPVGLISRHRHRSGNRPLSEPSDTQTGRHPLSPCVNTNKLLSAL